MITVELDIFSGRPNPVWQLTKAEEKELMDRLHDVPSLAAPRGRVTPKLGYRGFVIRMDEAGMGKLKQTGIPKIFRIGGLPGSSDIGDASLSLLESSGKLKLPDDVFNAAEDKIRELDQMEKPDPGALLVEPPAKDPEIPDQKGVNQYCTDYYLTSSSNFSFWNSSSYVYYNNCYNYASNYRNNTFAQPGVAGGYSYSSFSCSSVGPGPTSDGYSDYCVSQDNIKIALVIWPNVDFHFYRMCSGYKWCHKAGSTPATNVDNSGNTIWNPETANRGNYTNFCEYFYAYRSVAVTR